MIPNELYFAKPEQTNLRDDIKLPLLRIRANQTNYQLFT